MAARHLSAYRKIPAAQVVALVGTSQPTLAELGAKFGIPSLHTRLDDLGDIDAVDIVTPTSTHAQLIITSFRRGWDVLCEKPLALTVAEADRILAAQNAAGKLLMLGFTLRFTREYVRAKQLAASGALGEIKIAWCRRGKGLPPQPWYRDPARSGGVTAELAAHDIDWLRWIANSEIRSVMAAGTGDIYGLGKDDNVWATYTFHNGAIGVVGSSYSFSPFDADVGVIGTKLALKLDRGRVTVIDYRKRESKLPGFAREYLGGLAVPLDALTDVALRQELDHFVACVRDRRAPLVTGADGRENLRVVEATVAAMRAHSRIDLAGPETPARPEPIRTEAATGPAEQVG